MHPNITACHFMILVSIGAPLIPTGGSVCKRRRSRMSLLLAGVDIFKTIKNDYENECENECENEYENECENECNLQRRNWFLCLRL